MPFQEHTPTRPPSLPGDTTAPMAQRNRELEALYALSAALHGTQNLQQALPRALELVLEVFGFGAGVVRLLDPATGDLIPVAHAGLSPGARAEILHECRTGDAPAGLSVQQRSLVVIPSLPDSPYADHPWARHGYGTFVSAPLQASGMLLGCVNIAAPGERPFVPGDRELMRVLANQVAMAVANHELYSAAQRKIEYLSALHQYSRDLGPAPDLAHVLRHTIDRMAQLLRLERTAVFYWQRDSHELAGAAGRGFSAGAVEGLRAEVGCLPAAAAVLQDGQAWLSSDAAEGLLPHAFAREEGVGPALAVPLIAHDETIGFLLGDRRGQPLRISSDEMDLAQIFANHAAVWIANARLFLREQAARTAAEHSEAKFRDLLELAPDAIMVVNSEGRITLVNSQIETMFGYSRAELLGAPVEVLIPSRFRTSHEEHRTRYLGCPRTRPMGAGLELLALRKDGIEFPVEISLGPTHSEDGRLAIAVIRDTTESRRAALERERLLASEREQGRQLKLAIREAHHRIKNNLQSISDLLYLELAAKGEVSARDVLQESVERIQSIALVHDLLSQDQDVQTVDARAMAERLVPMVLRGHALSEEGVRLDMRVPSVSLSSKKATTLALILNELISNAAKHGLSGRPEPRLVIRMEQADEGLRLRVEDNGPGLPEQFDLERDANVGLQVVRTLAERDLGGKLTLSGPPGLSAVVWFPW